MSETKVTIKEIRNPYVFSAHKTSVQSITASVMTDVTWTEEYDPNNNFDGTSYTAPVTGYYHISASAIVKSDSGNATYLILVLLMSNGKKPAYANHVTGTGHTEYSPCPTCDVYMTAGQGIKVQAYVTGTSPSIWGEAEWTNHFSGHLISE